MILKRMFAAFGAAAMLIFCTCTVYADGEAIAADTAETDILSQIDAESVYVCETETGTVLYERNSDETLPMGHMAKLMTALITAEELESGKLSAEDITVVSANANSKQGTQIWLDVGEKISVDELLKSITIGNANDACTALAEMISGSEEAFVKRMNKRAKRLGMTNTYFADCTGTDSSAVSTAHDIAILSSEIVKYENLTEYFTTWIDYVRGKATELVSTNRLIRTYKGTTGLKSCSVESVGECISACAKRSNFSVCVVLLGCKSQDNKFSCARELLDSSFDNFYVFSPEIDKKYLQKVKVDGGEFQEISVKLDDFTNVILPKGTYVEEDPECEFPESVKAPVRKGDVIARLNYVSNGETVLTVQIIAAGDVKIMNYKCALKKMLLNLLNIRS
jgi:D-alanyl-D-alanine carboxypeptidase (penicillin-binding protein 5/6)